jgi:hypothetical protein
LPKPLRRHGCPDLVRAPQGLLRSSRSRARSSVARSRATMTACHLARRMRTRSSCSARRAATKRSTELSDFIPRPHDAPARARTYSCINSLCPSATLAAIEGCPRDTLCQSRLGCGLRRVVGPTGGHAAERADRAIYFVTLFPKSFAKLPSIHAEGASPALSARHASNLARPMTRRLPSHLADQASAVSPPLRGFVAAGMRRAAQRALRAAEIRARPSGVLGPVLMPPWFAQRPPFPWPLRRHCRPVRVRAPQGLFRSSLSLAHSLVTRSLASLTASRLVRRKRTCSSCSARRAARKRSTDLSDFILRPHDAPARARTYY